MNKVHWLVAAVVAMGLPSPAFAQDAPEDTSAAPDEAVSDEAVSDEAVSDEAVSDESASEAEKALEQDMALFWGRRREVEVVQRRLHQKDGRFEITPFGSVIPNDDFIIYAPVGLRAGYHFSEAFAVELSFAYALDFESDLAKFLEGEPLELKRAAIEETFDMYYNVSVLWSPIYGKINVLGTKLAHFDTYVGLGIGLFHTVEIPQTNPDGNPVIKPSGSTVLGFRWWLTDHFNIRTEYRHFFFEKFRGGVSTPVELSLGVGFAI